MTEAPKAKINWGTLSSDSDGEESDQELEVLVPAVGEQPVAQPKETREAVAEQQSKNDRAHPNIVPFKESKHIRPKMKIKGGFKPEKLEKRKNNIRTAKNPFDIVGDSDDEENAHEASSQGEQQKSDDQAPAETAQAEGDATGEATEEPAAEAPKQQPKPVYKPKQKKQKNDAQLKEEAELDAMFNFIEGKGPKPKGKEGEEKTETAEGTTAEGKEEAKKKKKKKKEGKAEEKQTDQPAATTETKPAEAPAAQEPTISIEELMKKKAKQTKPQAGGKKKGAVLDVAKRQLEERAAKAKSKKVHEDL